MSPSVCSHVVLGKTARPKASPKCLPDRPAFVTQMLEGFGPRPTWLSTGSGPRPECFPHVTARPNIFSPEYGALLPHSWIQEAPLKGLEGGDFGDLYRKKTLLRQMDAKRPRHGAAPPPPNRFFLFTPCRLVFKKPEPVIKMFAMGGPPQPPPPPPLFFCAMQAVFQENRIKHVVVMASF